MARPKLLHPKTAAEYLGALTTCGFFEEMPERLVERVHGRVRDRYDASEPWNSLAHIIDYECIYEEGDYRSLTKDFLEEVLADADAVQETWQQHPNGSARNITLSAEIGKRRIKRTLVQESDYVDSEFFDWLYELLVAAESRLRLLPAPFAGDEAFLLADPHAVDAAEKAGLIPGRHQLRELQQAREARERERVFGKVRSVLWLDRSIVAFDGRSTLWMWEAHSGKCTKRISGHSYGEVRGAFPHPSGQRVVGFGDTGDLLYYELDRGEAHLVTKFDTYFRAGVLSSNGHTAWAGIRTWAGPGVYRGVVERWDLRKCVYQKKGKRKVPPKPIRRPRLDPLPRWEVHPESIHWLALSPTGDELFTGGQDAFVRRWDPWSGKDLGSLRLPVPSGWAQEGDLSADGSLLAVIVRSRREQIGPEHPPEVWDDQLFVFQTATSRCIASVRLPNCTPAEQQKVRFAPNGQLLVTFGSRNGSIYLSAIDGGPPRQIQLDASSAAIESVAFSADGHHIAAGASNEVYLVNVADRRVVHVLNGG